MATNQGPGCAVVVSGPRHASLLAEANWSGHGIQPIFGSSVEDALRRVGAGDVDAVIAALPLPEWTPEHLLETIQRQAPGTPVLFAGEPPEGHPLEAAQRLVRLGAFQFCPIEDPEVGTAGPLESLMFHARRAVRWGREVRSSHSANDGWRHLLIGDSPAMQAVASTIGLIAARRSTVLITGETGTGKEVVARTIHLASGRPPRSLVAVNCSALPENLLEAELFGHVKGAFTGAIAHRVGRFEQAAGGTLFLDEVAEMPLDLQAKLLRVLQEREFQRLGSSETVKTDARVVAACNVDLAERIRLGKFREDLYYRLNVVPLPIPPLRERLGDIPALVHHFLDKICRSEGIAVKRIGPESLARLMSFDWPGNVRQLENAVEMAIALSGARDTLFPADFPLPGVQVRVPAAAAQSMPMPEEGLDFDRVVSSLERTLISRALERTRGNKTLAAELLGLKRTTLTAKLKSLEMTAA